MTRTTSRYAYRTLHESGELAIRQREVLQLLIEHQEGLTCWEMARKLTRAINSVSPRMAELQRIRTPQGLPLIVINGTRVSIEGKRPNTIWRINPAIYIQEVSA